MAYSLAKPRGAADGGPWSISEASPQAVGALTRGVQARQGGGAGRIRRIVERAASGGCRLRGPRRPAARAEDIGERRRDRVADLRDIGAALRRRDVQVPDIGPRTASELVISIDIADFASHDRLASYCGLAPRNRRSGTSISSVSASRQGNKRLKNLLVFSCNCLARSRNRWGDYYARCRERGSRTARR